MFKDGTWINWIHCPVIEPCSGDPQSVPQLKYLMVYATVFITRCISWLHWDILTHSAGTFKQVQPCSPPKLQYPLMDATSIMISLCWKDISIAFTSGRKINYIFVVSVYWSDAVSTMWSVPNAPYMSYEMVHWASLPVVTDDMVHVLLKSSSIQFYELQ